jgi:hypothetical protein
MTGEKMNPYLLEVMLKEKRQDMLREAERQRMINEYEAANPPVQGRLVIALGDLLIRLGERLKQRYQGKLGTCRAW